MKIIEAISDTNIGGAGILLLNRLKHTDRKKYVSIVVLPKNSALKPRLEKLGIETVETQYGMDKSFSIRSVIEYIDIIKRINPDIVNSHGCLSSRMAAKICNVPVKICTRHCVYPVIPICKKFKVLIGAFNSCLSDRFIAVAFAAKDNLLEMGVARKKISVIINGAESLEKYSEIEKERIKNELLIPNDIPVLGICARLEACKDHECFFKALKILKSKKIKFVALVIGEGSLRKHLEELCKEYGLSRYVIFTGFIENVSPYINITDIVINCSVGTETSSLALSEGMSLAKPAIVSNYGGNPYMVKNGVNGFVYESSDYHSLAECIERLCMNRELYEKMSHESYKRFKQELNAENMTKKTNKLYDALYYADRTAVELKMKNTRCDRKIYKQGYGIYNGGNKRACHNGRVESDSFS